MPAAYVRPMANDLEPEPFSEEAFPLQAVTGTVIAGAFAVFETFGFGFLEPVYRRALGVELRHRGVHVEQEVKYNLFHLGEPVGYYKADMVVDSRVIVETKTGPVLDPLAPMQLLNYLCAARLTLGLVIYFGPKGAKVRRVISTDQGRSVAP
jgi:GxxExxY protein